MAFESVWQARSERARQIAHSYASAAEALVFYADLAEFQETLLRSLSASGTAELREPAGGSLMARLDQPRYRALVPKLLSWLQRSAPPPLASSAQRLLDDDPRDRHRMFDAYWAWAVGDGGMGDETRAFVVEAVLQPFAETMAAAGSGEKPGVGSPFDSTGDSAGVAQGGRESGVGPAPLADQRAGLADAAADRAANVENPLEPTDLTGGIAPGEPESGVGLKRCPACGGRPVVGLLREAGHGARRSLVCGLCSTEWRVPRMACPACGEDRVAALSTIRADAFPNAQVDVCATCQTYCKVLDLTRNNTMIAIVDDLATLPLDLWSREQGFTRLRPHLLRL